MFFFAAQVYANPALPQSMRLASTRSEFSQNRAFRADGKLVIEVEPQAWDPPPDTPIPQAGRNPGPERAPATTTFHKEAFCVNETMAFGTRCYLA